MMVRIRLGMGRPVQRKLGKNRHVAMAFSALLVPASLMAYALGIWRLASDMGIAGEPGLVGVSSHWQVWIGLGAALNLASATLKRYGGAGVFELPKILAVRFFPLRPRATSGAERMRARAGAA